MAHRKISHSKRGEIKTYIGIILISLVVVGISPSYARPDLSKALMRAETQGQIHPSGVRLKSASGQVTVTPGERNGTGRIGGFQNLPRPRVESKEVITE